MPNKLRSPENRLVQVERFFLEGVEDTTQFLVYFYINSVRDDVHLTFFKVTA